MINSDYFDVLNISDNQKSADMIQAVMGKKCLGAFFLNGSAKLYFQSGLREEVNIKLEEIHIDQMIEWNWETQSKENWHLAWQDHFKPVVIENKLAVIPYWENDYPVEIIIKIKPGMAFGTGHHETTWLMLRQMLKYLQPGMSVLDLGSGSGILSIAAKIMGARNVDAVEHDLDCEENFYENLALNGISEGIQFHHGDVLHWNKLNYDLILANINLVVIEKLIPRLKDTQCEILLSGLLDTNYESFEQLSQKYKLYVREKMIKGEWICILAEIQ